MDSARAAFVNVRLLGNQDTLFCAPLPEKEREKDGFLGPRGLAPRRASAQYYHDCEIAGDIDFIFGGADALFEQCVLRTVNNGLPHSWVTAPSGSAEGLGFVFWDCDFVSDSCPQGTGLGLSITKAIFPQHSFRFGVHSTVGKGTTFWFVMSDLPYVDDTI